MNGEPLQWVVVISAPEADPLVIGTWPNMIAAEAWIAQAEESSISAGLTLSAQPILAGIPT